MRHYLDLKQLLPSELVSSREENSFLMDPSLSLQWATQLQQKVSSIEREKSDENSLHCIFRVVILFPLAQSKVVELNEHVKLELACNL